MKRAVFFDWFNTLACYEPPREELQSHVLHEIGIDVSLEKLKRAILIADGSYFEENARFPIRKRTPEQQTEMYIRYQKIVLTEAGVVSSVEPETLLKIMRQMQSLASKMKFVLFDDVLPVLKTLKGRKLILGLLTNFDKDMTPICRDLGLQSYIDFFVTSGEVGVDKPEPPIFLEALKRAKVDSSEVILVGDQYKVDIVGARGVGIAPILLDRYDSHPEVNDCPRIRSLTEVTKYLK